MEPFGEKNNTKQQGEQDEAYLIVAIQTVLCKNQEKLGIQLNEINLPVFRQMATDIVKHAQIYKRIANDAIFSQFME